VNSKRYAPVERQKTDGGHRYVRLCDEPMHVSECLPWLIDNGYVKDDGVDGEGARILRGWGSTYFMCPFEKTVSR
jgi:hypothetical protein